MLELIKVKGNFISERKISNDKGTHVFSTFANADVGFFQVYSRESIGKSYLDDFVLFLKPSVVGNNLTLKLDSWKKV